MSEFMDKVKSGLAGIGKKTGQTVEIGKLKREVGKHRGTIAKEVGKLGEWVLEQSRAGQTQVDLDQDPFARSLCDIRFYTDKITELEEQINSVHEKD